MYKPIPIPATAQIATVGAASVAIGPASMARGELYQLISSTAAYFKQGTQYRITVPAKASLVDGETIVVTVYGQRTSREYAQAEQSLTLSSLVVTLEFDVAGNGVVAGNTQVNVSADTTAANVGARLTTALTAALASISGAAVTDNLNGTVDVFVPRQMDVVENVANAGCTVALQAITAAAAAGNMVVPAGLPLFVDGNLGKQAAILQVAAGGAASLTLCREG